MVRAEPFNSVMECSAKVIDRNDSVDTAARSDTSQALARS